MLPLDTIYNEDCLQGMRRMGDGTVDCIVCDPPYLLDNRGGGFWSKNEDPKANAATRARARRRFLQPCRTDGAARAM